MALTIRDGQKVWPYCPSCGCRLAVLKEDNRFHFQNNSTDPWDNRDARGCKCTYIDFVWDKNGKVIYC